MAFTNIPVNCRAFRKSVTCWAGVAQSGSANQYFVGISHVLLRCRPESKYTFVANSLLLMPNEGMLYLDFSKASCCPVELTSLIRHAMEYFCFMT